MKRVWVSLLMIGVLLWGSLLAASSKAPNVPFSTLDGKTYTFSDFRGKVVVVNFFASYCPPCMVELKELAKLYRKYERAGLVVVSLMVDEEGQPLLPHIVEAKGITYPVGMASEEMLKAFGNPPITPTTFIINREGEVVKRIVGYAGKKYLEKSIRSYLGE